MEMFHEHFKACLDAHGLQLSTVQALLDIACFGEKASDYERNNTIRFYIVVSSRKLY